MDPGHGAVSRRLVRAALVALVAFVVFRYVLRPTVIDGLSMAPTYGGRGFTFCRYTSVPPKRGDIVMIAYGGHDWYLLKRVIGLPGETIEFRKGRCHVDGRALDEPYVVYPCDWETLPRRIPEGSYYVIGDNRSVPLEAHVGGEVRANRIVGRPLW